MADTNRTGNQPATRTQSQAPGRLPAMALGGDLLSMSPFAVMRRLSDEMDRLFGDFGGTPFGGAQRGETSRMWSPALEIRQQGENLQVCAELPGIDPKEVSVEIDNDSLVIEGERKREQTSDEGGVHRSERSYGRFYRAVPLPEGVNPDQVRAKFENGLLQIDIPIPRAAENRRRIQVQSGSSTPSTSQQGTAKTS